MSSDSPKTKGTPGWNDPPVFTYDTQIQGGQTSKLNLTKRVSFPLASGVTSASQPVDPAGGPPQVPIPSSSPAKGPCLPPSLNISSLPPSFVISTGSSDRVSDDDTSVSSIAFEQVYANIETQIEEINSNNERTATDIKKKIKILENLWNENKFDPLVKSRIFELTKTIKEKNVKDGIEIQRGLMVDHALLCSSWIPALRHLLNSLNEKSS